MAVRDLRWSLTAKIMIEADSQLIDMIYMGLMGWILAGVFDGDCTGGCSA